MQVFYSLNLKIKLFLFCIDGKNMTNIFKIAIVNILFFCGLEGTKKKMTSAENRSHLLGLV